MKLSRDEMLKKLQENPDVTDEYVDTAYNENKQASEWYGGTVMSYEWKNRYLVRVCAYGDVRGEIFKRDPITGKCASVEEFCDKNNAGVLAELLAFYGAEKDSDIFITCDWPDLDYIQELSDANPTYPLIVFESNNNWFELEIYDKETREFITDSMCMDTLDYVEDALDFKWIQSTIDDIIKKEA